MTISEIAINTSAMTIPAVSSGSRSVGMLRLCTQLGRLTRAA
jgi:hypothetical protein